MIDAFTEQRKEMLRQMSEQADNSPEAKRKRAIEALGDKYVLHKANSPKRGSYNPITGAKA
jgi:hypothetical protein